ncbi:MAG: ribosome-associated translation inhibitor RaiA [Acidobacteriia bacterium]|nr:ribosome-associated translation inhibitor RaiA [Terriglobia bacterium]
MNVKIRAENIDLADALKSYIDRRLHFSLSRFGDRVGLITVRVSDLNGPRGGIDKACRISAELVPFGSVRVEDVDADLYTAIDRAVERLGRSFSRKLEREMESRRGRESVRIP